MDLLEQNKTLLSIHGLRACSHSSEGEEFLISDNGDASVSFLSTAVGLMDSLEGLSHMLEHLFVHFLIGHVAAVLDHDFSSD